MGNRCSSSLKDNDEGKGGMGAQLAHSAALEGWGTVPHLQFQAFAAAAGTPPITITDWYRRNAMVNCIALVRKGLCHKLT